MRRTLVIIGILFILSVNLPVAYAVKVGKNIDIRGETTADRQVVEPSIAVDPRNPNILVAGAQDLRLATSGGGGDRWGGYYRSTDGGSTWTSILLPGFPGDTSPQGAASPLRNFTGLSDVMVAFDRLGNVYYSGMASMPNASMPPAPAPSGQQSFYLMKIFVAKLTNDGAYWAGATVLSTPGSQVDFPRMAIDTSGGSNDGNIYLTFSDCPGPFNFFLPCDQGPSFTRSTDGGHSFSTPIPMQGKGVLDGVTVDSAGNVYVVSDILKNSIDAIFVAKSTNGGLSFGQAIMAYSVVDIPNPLPDNQFFGGKRGPQITTDDQNIDIADADFRTGDADVVFARSTDGSLNWSNPQTVNDVTQGQQFTPTIATSGGIISVAWYDSRLGTLSNGTITGLDVFYAQSNDGGLSFSKNIRVTSVSFNPNTVALGTFQEVNYTITWLGDYISLAATPTTVHPLWTDNRNACDTIDPTFGCVDQDAYTATISGSLASKLDQIPTPLTPGMILLSTLLASTALALLTRKRR